MIEDPIWLNAMEKHNEHEYIVVSSLWNDFLQHPKRTQRWKYINPNMLSELWVKSIYCGKLSDWDKKRIDLMVDRALDNAIQLKFNTVMCGHSSHNPLEFIREFVEEDQVITQQQIDDFIDTIIDPKNGQLWISDYGLDPIYDILFKLLQEQSHRKKLLMIYRILNVVHRRSDLSAHFIKGGLKSVNIAPEIY